MKIDLDAMIEMVGTQGRYHYILIILMSIMAITSATILYSSSFLYADPDFTCTNAEGKDYSCKEDIFCAMYPGEREKGIDYHYHSWVEKYDLICENGSTRNLYKQ